MSFHDAAREVAAGAPALHALLMPRDIAPPAYAPHAAASLPPVGGRPHFPFCVPADDMGRRWWISWGRQPGLELQPAGERGSALSHAAAVGFLSDLSFLWAALPLHAEAFDLQMITSLDHAMHFHAPACDATGWLLYVMDSPHAAAGRALVHGEIWQASTGVHVASTLQEGVLRMAPKAKL